MRKYAILDMPIDDGDSFIIRKIMLFKENKNNTYVFLYDDIDEDSACCADYWFNNLNDALEYITDEYGVTIHDLIKIDDPLPYCQHDIISPIRVKGRNIGKEEWNKWEICAEGKWIPFIKKK